MQFTGCTRKNTSDEQAQCVLEKTGVMNLPQICISCLAISATGGFSPKRILKDCLLTSQGEVNLPGLLVLSKRPLINPVVKYFLPVTRTTVRRGYIHFQVHVIPIYIVCNLFLFFYRLVEIIKDTISLLQILCRNMLFFCNVLYMYLGM